MTTFPSYFLILLLKRAGWPRPKGLLNRKQVVSSVIVRELIVCLVKTGIAFGACRPRLGTQLLADAFRQRNWSEQPPDEMWNDFDLSEQIDGKPDIRPEEAIVMSDDLLNQLPQGLADVIQWELVKTNSLTACYHAAFVRGLIWGLAHPEEAATRHEEQRQKYLRDMPGMVQAGLNVDASLTQTFGEFVSMIEEMVDLFQDRSGPLAEIPQELSAFPLINARISQDDQKNEQGRWQRKAECDDKEEEIRT